MGDVLDVSKPSARLSRLSRLSPPLQRPLEVWKRGRPAGSASSLIVITHASAGPSAGGDTRTAGEHSRPDGGDAVESAQTSDQSRGDNAPPPPPPSRWPYRTSVKRSSAGAAFLCIVLGLFFFFQSSKIQMPSCLVDAPSCTFISGGGGSDRLCCCPITSV